jgi:hypothetical protein
MKLVELSELVWKLVQAGRPNVQKQTFHEPDVRQFLKVAVANSFREMFYTSKKESRYNEPDYFFSSPLLDVKRFELTAANMVGMRRADMSAWDLYRLPRNSHFTNIYPVAGESGCGNQEVGEITQVSPGEENFYATDPDYENFQFYVVKGRGINTYNIPPCIKSVDIEATYEVEDVDITMDIAFTAASTVLARLLQTNDATGETQKQLKHELEKREGFK